METVENAVVLQGIIYDGLFLGRLCWPGSPMQTSVYRPKFVTTWTVCTTMCQKGKWDACFMDCMYGMYCTPHPRAATHAVFFLFLVAQPNATKQLFFFLSGARLSASVLKYDQALKPQCVIYIYKLVIIHELVSLEALQADFVTFGQSQARFFQSLS